MGDPIAQFIQWYKQKSILSKLYFTIGIIMNACIYFNILEINYVFYDATTIQNFEVWRMFTSILYIEGYSIIMFIIKFYIAYTIVANLQKKVFGREQFSDFIWILILLCLYITVAATIKDVYMTNTIFNIALIGIWYAKKPYVVGQYVLKLQTQPSSLLIAYIIFTWIQGAHAYIYQVFAGAIFACIYYYVKFPLYHKTGKDYLKAPKIISNIMDKYKIVEKQWNLVKEEDQQFEVGDDPYNQY